VTTSNKRAGEQGDRFKIGGYYAPADKTASAIQEITIPPPMPSRNGATCCGRIAVLSQIARYIAVITPSGPVAIR
jgi:hypothetical protein